MADENKRLKAFLRTQGVSDKEIDALTGGRDIENGNTEFASAVQRLEVKLAERRPCNGGDVGKSSRAASAKQKMSGNTPIVVLKTQEQQRGSVGSVARQSISHSASWTSASSLVTTPSSPSFGLVNYTTETGLPNPKALDNLFPQHPITHPLPHPQPHLQLQDYHQNEHEYPEYSNTTHFPQWQQPMSTPSGNSINAGIVDHGDSSSCAFAADVLRGMGADVSAEELNKELGCTTTQTDCGVHNRVLFDVMDRYTSGPGPGRL